MSKRKIKWHKGDVFVVKLMDGTYTIGQVLDLQMTNIISCAFFDERYASIECILMDSTCNINNLISIIACTKEKLDYDIWKIIGNKPIEINEEKFPNEQFRHNGWIGAKSYDAGIIEEFLDAYNALTPWDDWYNPNYLDELLIDISKRPTNLVYKNK
jgi:hypothetical protein